MVKRKATGLKQQEKKSDAEVDIQDRQHDPPQRLRKKITKRAQFLENVEKSHKLALKPDIHKKRKRKKAIGAALGNLSNLTDALGLAEEDVKQRQQRKAKGLGSGGAEARRKLASSETLRLQKVLAHPQFQGDPIAAVAGHLGASLPPVEAVKKPKKNVSGSQKRKARQQRNRLKNEMDE